MGSLLPRLSLIMLMILASCTGSRIKLAVRVSADGWKMYGRTADRANVAREELMPPLKAIWEYDANAGIRATPLVIDSVVFIATLKGELHAVNLVSGQELGYASFGSPISSTPVISGHTVIAANSEMIESIVCVNVWSGDVLWEAAYGPVESSLLLAEKKLYVTSLWGVLHCVDPDEGTEVWKFETGPVDQRKPIRSSPATDGNVVAFGDDAGWVYAVGIGSGKLIWKTKTDGPVWTDPVLNDGMVFVSTLKGVCYALDAGDGAVRWKHDTRSVIYASVAARGDRIFLASADGVLRSLDASTGSVLWTFKATSVFSSAPLVSGSVLYIGSMDHNLYAVDVSTGREVWRTGTEGRIRVSPVVIHKTLLLASEDRLVTAYRAEGEQ